MAADGGVRHDAATVHCGDALATLRGMPSESVQCAITSPPYYGLRDYGHAGQVGLEATPAEYVARLVEVFREVRRVLRPDGTLWLNLGDSYNSPPVGRFNGGGFKDASAATGGRDLSGVETSGAVDKLAASGLPPKNLLGIPWRVAFALQDAGWYLRQDIVWSKPNPMPESVRDRCTKSHEYVFLLSKSSRYFFDAEAIKERGVSTAPAGNRVSATRGHIGGGGRWDANPDPSRSIPDMVNRRSVWTVTPDPYPGAHFAVMPPELVRPCVLAGTSGRGCCAACGSPWVRVVERESRYAGKSDSPYLSQSHKNKHAAHVGHGLPSATVQTLGWAASCDCPPADPVPCTVLDPFAGSGTTLAVAVEEGRHAVGIELNPDYVGLIHRRLGGVTPGLFV